MPLSPATEPPLIALAGPTAAGKTAAALAIARRFPVEVVSVDSALVYRGMDIGTAKPTADERAAVPHHLIDIRDPAQAYSAAEFCRDAAPLLAAIRARGRLPLLVGGTMLYFKALFDGLDDMPAAQPAVRARIAADAAERGWPALHAELARVDPATAARLAPNDAQRIGRALEVWQASGRPLSAFQTRLAGAGARPAAPAHVLISLEPHDRLWLHQRIAQRFDDMLAQGLVAEVWALMQRGDLHPELPSMRCVGYRQAWQVLAREQAGQPVSERAQGLALAAHNRPTDATPAHPAKSASGSAAAPPILSAAALRELRDGGVAATRQLAKRQITWLRAMPQRQAVACDAPDALDQVLAQVARHWPG